MLRRLFFSTGILCAAGTLLIGCGTESGDSSGTSSPATSSSPASAAAPPEITDVDPTAFAMNDRYVFDVRPGGGDTRLCVLGDGGVTCAGTPPPDAPEVTVPPFPTQKPGAVSLGKDGLSWTVLEGVPPAPGELGRNQRISDGGVECTMDDRSDFTCTAGDNGFTVSGPDADIRLRGTLRVTGTPDAGAASTSADTPSLQSGADGNREPADQPVEPGTWCGVDSDDRTSVVVDSGRVGCSTAASVIDEYLARRGAEGGGNTLTMTVGEWGCSSPTAGRSQELGEEVFHGAAAAGAVCEQPDGAARIVAPAD